MIGLGETQGGEHHVGSEQYERRRRQATVPAKHAVLPDDSFDLGDSAARGT